MIKYLMLQKNHEWEQNTALLIQTKQEKCNRERINKKLEQRDFIVVTDYMLEDKCITLEKNSIYPQVREVVSLNIESSNVWIHKNAHWSNQIFSCNSALPSALKYQVSLNDERSSQTEMFVICGNKK